MLVSLLDPRAPPREEAIRDGVPFERDDYETLVGAPERFENAWEHIEDPEPFAAINDRLFPYAEALAGADTLEHPGDSIQVTPRFPNGEVREGASLPAYRDGEWVRGEYLAHQTDPLEIHGDAGTTVFWHQNLLHCGGINNGRHVRLSAIQRFSRPDAEEIKREAYAKPFEYWGGMDGVDQAT